jgi:membrane protein required for colicin V production
VRPALALDLAVLAVLAFAALSGAMSGALRQVVQLAAAAAGWLAARHLAAPVARALARSLPDAIARAAASSLLFLGTLALVTLVGAAILKGTRVSRAVKGPADRGVGALLGGAKGILVAWVLLSAIAIARDALPDRMGARVDESELATLARSHNLLERLAPRQVDAIERLKKW